MLLKIGEKLELIKLRRRILITYARPQDYALDPESDECKEWPECEMNAGEEEGLLMMILPLYGSQSMIYKECKYVRVAKV